MYPHDDPLVVSVQIANTIVHRTLVDSGSSANILFREAFDKLQIGEKHLRPVGYSVSGFTGSSVIPDGIIKLPIKIGEASTARNLMADFLVVNVPGAYNAIAGRPLINDIQGVVSTYHLTMIYAANDGKAAKVRGNKEVARSCYITALKKPISKRTEPQSERKRKRQVAENKDLSMENFDAREEKPIEFGPTKDTE